MRNFFLTLTVLLGLTAIAKAECGCGQVSEPTSNIICNWFYSQSVGLWYECYNDQVCVDLDPEDPGLGCPPIITGSLDIDKHRARFGAEVNVDNRRNA